MTFKAQHMLSRMEIDIFEKRNLDAFADLYQLTTREVGVVRQLLLLKTNKEIALELHICTRVVERHIAQIYKKLGVERRVQAIIVMRSLVDQCVDTSDRSSSIAPT
jgi:DNA-binding NarL/FixJ family response regulator